MSFMILRKDLVLKVYNVQITGRVMSRRGDVNLQPRWYILAHLYTVFGVTWKVGSTKQSIIISSVKGWNCSCD